jgi:hypothetical protein
MFFVHDLRPGKPPEGKEDGGEGHEGQSFGKVLEVNWWVLRVARLGLANDNRIMGALPRTGADSVDARVATGILLTDLGILRICYSTP